MIQEYILEFDCYHADNKFSHTEKDSIWAVGDTDAIKQSGEKLNAIRKFYRPVLYRLRQYDRVVSESPRKAGQQ